MNLKRKIKSLTQRFRFYLSASNNPLFIGYYKYVYKPKPGTIACFLDEFSKNRHGNIFVIQVGANDGINNDPIHKFIKRDNWSGILIEPQKAIFEKYLKNLYSKHSNIITLCKAIGSSDATSTLYKIGWCDMRWASGLSSFKKENIQNAYDNGFVKKVSEKYNLSIPEDRSTHIVSEQVDKLHPSTLISKYNVKNIDLLQIDVEGFDYEVIKLFDIVKTRPASIIYENIHLSENDKNECKDYLVSHGYKVTDFDSNTLAFLDD